MLNRGKVQGQLFEIDLGGQDEPITTKLVSQEGKHPVNRLQDDRAVQVDVIGEVVGDNEVGVVEEWVEGLVRIIEVVQQGYRGEVQGSVDTTVVDVRLEQQVAGGDVEM